MKKLPPLNWLRSFEASARHLNFTHAAEELNLTQAAISKQIRNLEYTLGTSLFVRLPRGLELSENGAAYLPAVKESIANLPTSAIPGIPKIHIGSTNSSSLKSTCLIILIPDSVTFFYLKHCLFDINRVLFISLKSMCYPNRHII